MDRDAHRIQIAEYAMGLLDDSDRQKVAHLIATDPDTRAEAALWTESLVDLMDVDDVAPPPALLSRIKADAFGAPDRAWWQDIFASEHRTTLVAVAATKITLIVIVVWLMTLS